MSARKVFEMKPTSLALSSSEEEKQEKAEEKEEAGEEGAVALSRQLWWPRRGFKGSGARSST